MAEQQGVPAPHAETLEASRLLREWSRSLRRWSRLTRQRCREDRETRGAAIAPHLPFDLDPATYYEPSMGQVSVVDLFVILVERHGFEVREAVRLLTLGMLAAGYQGDSEFVSASDAMDIIEAIVGQTRGGSGPG